MMMMMIPRSTTAMIDEDADIGSVVQDADPFQFLAVRDNEKNA